MQVTSGTLTLHWISKAAVIVAIIGTSSLSGTAFGQRGPTAPPSPDSHAAAARVSADFGAGDVQQLDVNYDENLEIVDLGNVAGSVHSNARPGVLRTVARSNPNDPLHGLILTQVAGGSYFHENVQLNVPTLGVGHVRFKIRLTGRLVVPAHDLSETPNAFTPTASAGFFVSLNGNESIHFYNLTHIDTENPLHIDEEISIDSLPISFGEPLSLSLTGRLDVVATNGGEGFFENTAKFVGAAVFDSDNNPIQDFSLTSSGYDYQTGTAIPEPGISSILILPLLTIGLRRTRSRITCRPQGGGPGTRP